MLHKVLSHTLMIAVVFFFLFVVGGCCNQVEHFVRKKCMDTMLVELQWGPKSETTSVKVYFPLFFKIKYLLDYAHNNLNEI